MDARRSFGGYQNTIQVTANGGLEQVIFEDGENGHIIANIEWINWMWCVGGKKSQWWPQGFWPKKLEE